MLKKSFHLFFTIILLLASFDVFSAQARQPTPGAPQKPQPPQTPSYTASISMPGGPLQITVNNDGSLGLREAGVIQFYAENASGVFLWSQGQAFGPKVPAGAYHNEFNYLGQGGPYGQGTAGNPWRILTHLSTSTGLLLDQEVRYVNGERKIDFAWTVTNQDASQSFSLFHAADLYISGDDYGVGYFDSANRRIGGVDRAQKMYGLFTPITPASAYQEAYYSAIWYAIGEYSPGSGFNNTLQPTYIDNGAGLQWNYPALASGASYTFRDQFSVTPSSGGTSDVEQPPLSLAGSSLPGLREFEFGASVAASPESGYTRGAVSFNLPVSRYYGNFGANNVRFNSLVDSSAYLTLRVFDVDSPQEVDTVQVNGHAIGNITGNNGGWREVTLSFPSSYLNFPSPPPIPGDSQALEAAYSLPPASNQITINIDTANRGYKALVAWARLYVGGVRPVLFAHGFDLTCSNGQNRSLGSFKSWFAERGIPALGARNDGSKTIQTQADQMTETYAEMQRLFGLRKKGQAGVSETDRILLLGHSMGGFTGRRFLNQEHSAGNLLVERFLDLASPNDGNDVSAIGAPFLCSKEAANNISSNYMRKTFNPNNDLSTKWSGWSQYGGSTTSADHMTSLAARWWYIPNDDVVWVDESHVLSYDTDLLYKFPDDGYAGESSTFNVLHNAIYDFRSMWDRVVPILGIGEIVHRPAAALAAARFAGPQAAPAPALSPASGPENGVIAVYQGVLSPGAPQTFPFPVDSVQTLVAGWGADSQLAALTFNLQTPGGTTIGQPADANSLAIDNPQAGAWSLQLQTKAGVSAPVAYSFSIRTQSELHLIPAVEPQAVSVGSAAVVGLQLLDGSTPLTGAAAAGGLVTPGGSFEPVTLYDDGAHQDGSAGDGLYAVEFWPAAEGAYTFDLEVSGLNASGQPFMRQTTMALTGMPGGVIADAPVDWATADFQPNQLADVLTATLTVDLPAAGQYRFIAGLGVPGQPQIGDSQVELELPAGPQTVALPFSGEFLGSLNTQDLYQMQNLQVFSGAGQLLDAISSLPGMYYIDSYQFEHPLLAAAVSGAAPVDGNLDGLYDSLDFSLNLETERNGAYNLLATLNDANGQAFDFYEQGVYLYSGSNPLTLSFRGANIRKHNVSGPFTLANLVISPQDPAAGLGSLHFDQAYTTGALDASEFVNTVQLSISSNVSAANAFVRAAPAAADGSYDLGSQVELDTVVNAPGFKLVYWEVNGVQYTGPSLTLQMSADTSVYAYFETNLYLPLLLRR